ncbi:MAG: hypothetical protein ACK5Q5_05430 [Planctomycetaceae bacterium]
MMPTFMPREAERINIGRVRYNRRRDRAPQDDRTSELRLGSA